MVDNFYLSGIDAGRWFEKNFEEYHLFGYVGDRERLGEAMKKKSFLRRLSEIVAPRVNIGTVLNALANYDLVKIDPNKTLAREIINLVNEEENSRKITQLLESTYKRGIKQGTFFDLVSKSKYGKQSIFKATFNQLQDQLVTVEGQLLHRSAVPQFSRTLSAALRASEGEWILGDFPPHGLVEGNSSFTGKVLLLHEDPGLTTTFAAYLPFCPELSWYPYIRVTGFFDASRVQTEVLPKLSVSLVEYRRPKIFREVRDSVLRFATREISGRRNYLNDWSDLIMFGYLVPILFKGSNLDAADADPEIAHLMHEYKQQIEKDLPQALAGFYDSLPVGSGG
jgi:hypothetical protein